MAGSNDEQWSLTPRFDQESYNYPQSTSTSEGMSHLGDLTESTTGRSVYSYQSSRDVSKYIKAEAGRIFNSQNDQYFLPTDNDEWDRLDKQHVAFVIGFGGLTPCHKEVTSILQNDSHGTSDEPKRVLDLGCGTGTWVIEMAKEFPSAEVVGVDLAPVPLDGAELPSNCRFEIDDINNGLEHFYGKFYVVHARLITAGLKDARSTLREIMQCLKPGGIAIFIENDPEQYEEDKVTPCGVATEQNPDGSWLLRFANEMRAAALFRGSDLVSMEECFASGFWDQEYYDPETCGAASVYFPTGPWPRSNDLVETQLLQHAGSLIRKDMLNMATALHPLLMKLGIPLDVLDTWTKGINDQLSSPAYHTWICFNAIWGRRRDVDGISAPNLPTITQVDFHYPAYYVCKTQAEWKKATSKRGKADRPIATVAEILNRRVT